MTKKEEEILEENKDKKLREDALQKIIDKQIADDAEEENYSIEDKAGNPMNAVLNQK